VDGKDARSFRARGTVKAQKGDLAGAIRDFDRAIALNKNDADAYGRRGHARMDQKDYRGALEDLNRAVDMDPKLYGGYLTRASVRRLTGDYTKAIADFEAATRIHPERVEGRVGIANVQRCQGENAGALASVEEALRIDPKNTYAYSLRAEIQACQGKTTEALADCDRVVALAPTLPRGYRIRGLVRFITQSPGEALADWRKACEATQDELDYVHVFIWLARAKLKQTEEASKELAAYCAQRPKEKQNDWVASIGSFLAGTISEEQLLQAAASSDSAVERGQDCEGWFYAGMKRRIAGDEAGAAELFRKCVATELRDFAEYEMAAAELKAMGK